LRFGTVVVGGVVVVVVVVDVVVVVRCFVFVDTLSGDGVPEVCWLVVVLRRDVLGSSVVVVVDAFFVDFWRVFVELFFGASVVVVVVVRRVFVFVDDLFLDDDFFFVVVALSPASVVPGSSVELARAADASCTSVTAVCGASASTAWLPLDRFASASPAAATRKTTNIAVMRRTMTLVVS
jgi:hypothetical protein